jgi:coproporphyrinogen III oxidase-like Fe-S oxidoreductase
MDPLAELDARMARPQRHRLLQGYPAVPLMRAAVGSLPPGAQIPRRRADGSNVGEDKWIDLDRHRPLIVGVLPHSMCSPAVQGCGFCTFPHPVQYSRRLQETQEQRTLAELHALFGAEPQLTGRKVEAIYFGGATANLSKPEVIAGLYRALAEHVQVDEAEITLEGIAPLFLQTFGDRLGPLAELGRGPKRISMGIQTFAPDWLAKMGRTGFGKRATFEKVVRAAHKRGMTASGDLLFNLPGQRLDEMLADVSIAAELGLDQICLYNLVLTEDLGTPWSQDADLLAKRPTNATAVDAWLALRENLLSLGFVQTTLTNFERGERRFAYEVKSFTPELYDGLGIGQHGISTFVDLGRKRAVKLLRAAGRQPWGHGDLWFPYDRRDLELLFLTRSLPKLAVHRSMYTMLFGEELTVAHAPAIDALRERCLVTIDDDALRLTPRGMFYADSVVGLLAAARADELKPAAANRHTLSIIRERRFYGGMG